jgi:2-polyprenyl-3-methyl-5-hydroxy-6-metoxy-1,4-benzoquinol methylase
MSVKSNERPRYPYSNEFFDESEKATLQSARVVIPIVLQLINAASVLDLGCGRGAWLRVFQELGISLIRGLDGDYVERSRLLVPEECFTCTELSKPFTVPGRYDLAVCLEVAEHLPDIMAPVLIDRLVKAAPAVLFSAALPGQGGLNHINERMPAYWRSVLSARVCFT